jgi:hypothetical protein
MTNINEYIYELWIGLERIFGYKIIVGHKQPIVMMYLVKHEWFFGPYRYFLVMKSDFSPQKR